MLRITVMYHTCLITENKLVLMSCFHQVHLYVHLNIVFKADFYCGTVL